jgi:hypothetical protein
VIFPLKLVRLSAHALGHVRKKGRRHSSFVVVKKGVVVVVVAAAASAARVAAAAGQKRDRALAGRCRRSRSRLTTQASSIFSQTLRKKEEGNERGTDERASSKLNVNGRRASARGSRAYEERDHEGKTISTGSRSTTWPLSSLTAMCVYVVARSSSPVRYVMIRSGPLPYLCSPS